MRIMLLSLLIVFAGCVPTREYRVTESYDPFRKATLIKGDPVYLKGVYGDNIVPVVSDGKIIVYLTTSQSEWLFADAVSFLVAGEPMRFESVKEVREVLRYNLLKEQLRFVVTMAELEKIAQSNSYRLHGRDYYSDREIKESARNGLSEFIRLVKAKL